MFCKSIAFNLSVVVIVFLFIVGSVSCEETRRMTEQPQPIDIEFVATSLGSCGYASFEKNGSVFYYEPGCALNAGRGFNVAIVDIRTGEILNTGVNFDTWYSREADAALASFLHEIPDGRLILIAVGDDAGGFQASLPELEALGSKQIRSYIFWDSWAMIAIKGRGVALDERYKRYELGTDRRVTARAVITTEP